MMEFKGMIQDIGLDYKTGKKTIKLVMDSDEALAELNDLIDRTVQVTIKKPSRSRSMKANAYAWVLMQAIAEKIGSTKDDVYLEMLHKYSGLFAFCWIKDEDYERFKSQYRTFQEIAETFKAGVKGHDVIFYLGMSAFDNWDMKRFIDGLVYECQSLDIATIPQSEIERMKEEWGITRS